MVLEVCGVNCEDCTLRENCGGSCAACKGKPFYLVEIEGVDICPLYDCAVNKKGYTNCGACAELPCQLFTDWKDPSMTDEQHQESIRERVALLKAV